MSASPRARRDPVALPDGCDLHESTVKGITVVIPPMAQARMIFKDPKAALHVTIPWDIVLASARRCKPSEFSNP
jgi:hypothetical protein